MLNNTNKGEKMFDMDLTEAVGAALMGDTVVWIFFPSPTGGETDSLIKSVQCRSAADAEALLNMAGVRVYPLPPAPSPSGGGVLCIHTIFTRHFCMVVAPGPEPENQVTGIIPTKSRPENLAQPESLESSQFDKIEKI